MFIIYTATSTTNIPSVAISNLRNQSTPEPSSSSQPCIAPSKKRKTQHLPLQPKPSKAPKPGVNIHEANEDDSNGIAGSGIETTIPEHFTQPSHAERRQRSANAWQELMPSLIHPLMAALHRMAPNNTDGVPEVETFTCNHGCNIRKSTVKRISFGGM